jgi:hypothetical protein
MQQWEYNSTFECKTATAGAGQWDSEFDAPM